MATKIVQDTSLTAVADAIRAKGETESPLEFPDGFISAIEDIKGSNGGVYIDEDGYLVLDDEAGGGITWDALATNTEPSGAVVLSDNVTRIEEYAFFGKPITSIIAPSVTSIGASSLQNTQITSITDENFPSLGVTSMFQLLLNCKTLQHIKLTGAKIALNAMYVMRNNAGLITAEFPNAAKSVGASYVGMPQLGFSGCPNLTLVDVGYMHTIGANTFSGDTVFQTLIIRYGSVATLNNINAFNNTPFKSGGTGGTLYVPQDLISSYESATNWSTILGYENNQIKAIEGSEYE